MINKKGWSLKEMIILSGVLAIFLLIAIYYIVTLYSDFGQELNNNYYHNLENQLEEVAYDYVNEEYDTVLDLDEINISKYVLEVYDKDFTLQDEDGKACDGYVSFAKSNGNIYVEGYINCASYMTEGYQEWKD